MKLLFTVDDFGLSREVNQSVISLTQNRKINSVAVMCHRDAALSEVSEFIESVRTKFSDPSDFYLAPHLVLNEELSYSGDQLPATYKEVFVRAFSKSFREQMRGELRRQLDRYFSLFDRAAFLTSHQHVHLLPNLTGLFVDLAKEYKINKMRYSQSRYQVDKQGLLSLSSTVGRFLNRHSFKGMQFIQPIGINHSGMMSEAELKLCLEEAEKFKTRQNGSSLFVAVEILFHTGIDHVHSYNHWNFNWAQEHALLLRQEQHEI